MTHEEFLDLKLALKRLQDKKDSIITIQELKNALHR